MNRNPNLAQAREFLRRSLPARLCVTCNEIVLGKAPDRCPHCQVGGLLPIDEQVRQSVADNLGVPVEAIREC